MNKRVLSVFIIFTLVLSLFPTSITFAESVNSVIPKYNQTIAAGEHSLAIKPDFGQLGDGTTENRNRPVQVEGSFMVPGDDIDVPPAPIVFNPKPKVISKGSGYTFAIDQDDGTVWGWGSDCAGRLGFGGDYCENYPTPTQKDGIINIVKVVSSGDHSLALQDDGTVWSWGSNKYGEVGNGSTTTVHTPVAVLEDVVDIGAAEEASIAVKSDGSVWVWGGIGTESWYRNPILAGEGTSTPRLYPYLDNVIAVEAGDYHVFAIKEDGSLWGWGKNDDYQVSIRCNSNCNEATKITLDDVVDVSVGLRQSFAVQRDGTVWAWGYNTSYGWPPTLGNPSFTSDKATSPIQVVNINDAIAVNTYYGGGVYAISEDGTVWGWGNRPTDGFGDGNTTRDTVTSPIKIETFNNVVTMRGNVVLKDDESVWSWGSNASGQLGIGYLGGDPKLTPVKSLFKSGNSPIDSIIDKINENPQDTTTEDLIDIGIEDVIEDNLDEYRDALEEYKEDIGRDLTPEDIQKVIDAVNAVIEAERNPTRENIDHAQECIDRLEDGSLKDRLQERLDNLKNSLIPEQPYPFLAYNPVLGAYSVILNWLPTDRAEYYLIERDNIQIARVDEGRFQEYLTEQGTYTYHIYAGNDYGLSEPAIVTVEANHQDIPSVEDFRATSISHSAVTIEWSLVQGATHYDLFRNNQLIETVTDGIFIDDQVVPESTYTYSITARNQYNSSAAVEINVQIPSLKPNTPEVAVHSTPSTVTLTWNEDTSTDYYRIERDGVLIESNVMDTRYVDHNVVASTAYDYRVIAINEYGETASEVISVTTERHLPAAPIVQSIATATSVTLTWEATDHSDHYRVVRDGTVIQDLLLGITFTDDQVQPGTTYQYQVVAVNEAGETASEVVTVTTLEPFLPGTPDQIRFTTTTNEVELSWNPTENTDSYQVKIDGEIVKETSEITAVISGLTPNTSYNIQVIAINEHGETASQVYEVRTKPLAPSVTDVVYSSTSTSITLSWSAEHADHYRIERDGQTIADQLTDLSYTDYSVRPSTTYQYVVVAVNESGEGQSIPILAATTESPVDPVEQAIEAVERAEQTLDPRDVQNAYPIVEGFEDNDIREELLDRLEGVKSKIRAKEAVERVERTIERDDYHLADEEVSSLREDSFKEGLRSRLIFILDFVDAHDLVKQAVETKEKEHINQAHIKVESLPGHQHKIRLQEIIKNLLDDQDSNDKEPKPDYQDGREDTPVEVKPVEKQKGYRKEQETIIVFVPQENVYDLGMIELKDMENVTEIVFEVPEGMKQPVISIPKKIYEAMSENETKVTYELSDTSIDIVINESDIVKEIIQVQMDFTDGIRIESDSGTMITIRKELPRNQMLVRYNPDSKTWDEFDGTWRFDRVSSLAVQVELYEKTFTDLQQHWAKDEIESLASMRIVQGRTVNLFIPDDQITRAEFVAMFNRALELKSNGQDIPFSDVELSKWYSEDIRIASGYGFVKGFNDDTFKPQKNLTREEMITILIRFYESRGHELAYDSNALFVFDDHLEIGSWASEYMAKALKIGLVNGVTPKTLSPKKNASRAEAAVLIYRLLNDYSLTKPN